MYTKSAERQDLVNNVVTGMAAADANPFSSQADIDALFASPTRIEPFISALADMLRPFRVDAVVISSQHAPEVENDQLRSEIREHVIRHTVPGDLIDDNTKYHINPTGRFVIGGPHGAAVRLGLKRTSLVSTMRRLGITRPKPGGGGGQERALLEEEGEGE